MAKQTVGFTVRRHARKDGTLVAEQTSTFDGTKFFYIDVNLDNGVSLRSLRVCQVNGTEGYTAVRTPAIKKVKPMKAADGSTVMMQTNDYPISLSKEMQASIIAQLA